MNFIEKIEELQEQICCLKNSSGNPDIDLVNNGNGTFTFTNGVDAPVTFDSRISNFSNPSANVYILTDDFGNSFTLNLNFTETLTTYVPSTINSNKIGTYTDENGAPTDVFENLTQIQQALNGTITHINEANNPSTAVILSTDPGQLLKSGTDKGNLLKISDINSPDINNTIILDSNGKLKVLPTSVFPDDQAFNGIVTDTATVAFTPLPPNPQGQVDYNLQVVVKTQCEIDSDVNGIKLANSFYQNIGTTHLTNFATRQVFDANGELIQANVVKEGCALKVFVNKPETIFFKDNGISEAGFYALTDITVGGKAPDVISLIINNATANIDFSNWYANTLILGKKVGQKFIVALNINTPLYSLTFDHGGSGLVKAIFDTEILTVKALEADTLYED